MKKLWVVCLCAALTLALSAGVDGQSQPAGSAGQSARSITPNRVIGEVAAIDAATKQLTIRADAGVSVNALMDEKTAFLRTQPGATDLTGAVSITLAEISVGDRVLALGRVAEDRKSIAARQIIVMTKAAIARKREHDQAEWQRRGIAGSVAALNPETKEITLRLRSFGAAREVVIAAAGKNVVFRRYAPDSVKFADAKLSSFAELKVGDQLRALGDRGADGARFTPEEILSGSFRTLNGKVAAVNAKANEIKITDQQTGEVLTVVISQDSVLRHIPEEWATMKSSGGDSGGKPGAGAKGGQETDGGKSGDADKGKGGGFDLQALLQWMRAITIADVKPGDTIIVASTKGADPARITAITLVTGLDAFLQAFPQKRSAFGTSLGLPGGALDLGLGIP